ncbi:hypothetical protein [Aminipila sp.]|uniref:hypothetical protein n=1 Tax=Aminipila sp. TaxID=2060095 RepID=UPI00289C71DA|nr:hypothetical protein [Aminipila sp.]
MRSAYIKRNLDELKRLFKSGQVSTAILFIQCLFCFIIVAYLLNYTQSVNSQINSFNTNFNEEITYSLLDRAEEDGKFTKYMSYDAEYFNLYKFVQELKNTDGLFFYSIVEQPIDIPAENVSNKFAYGYEDGLDKESSYSVGEKGTPLIWAKSMQITDDVLEKFGVKVESGRRFTEKDFEFNPSDTVKVILGNEYKSYYQVGDLFDAEYLFTPIKCQVVGILPEKSLVAKYGNFIPLDRYILLPSFNKMSYYQNPELAKIVLSQQASGEITTTDQAIDVNQLVSHLSQKYDTLNFIVVREDLNKIQNLFNVSEETLKQLVILLISIIIFTIIGISVGFFGRIKRNYKTYGIHLLSGACMGDIAMYTINAIAVVIMSAYAFSAIISAMVFGIGTYLIIIFGLAVIILLLSSLYPIFKILNMETCLLIRREE